MCAYVNYVREKERERERERERENTNKTQRDLQLSCSGGTELDSCKM